jgi:hypothetical protein
MKCTVRWMKYGVLASASLLGVLVAVPALSREAARLEMRFVSVVQRYFGVNSYYVGNSGLSSVRVAILANGFGELADDPQAAEFYLPAKPEVITWENKGAKGLDSNDLTGLRAAIAIASINGATETNSPQIRLYNANSLKGFDLSFRDAADWNADVIVTYKNYESFGNFNQTGGITRLPELLARDKEMLWVHSPGLYRGLVRHGALGGTGVEAKVYGSLTGKFIPTQSNGYPFLRFKANASLKKVKVSLSWNAFPPYLDFAGTDKDLDLVVYKGDKDGRPIEELARSSRRQTANPSAKNESPIPMEDVTLNNLAPSENAYLIGILHSGGTLTAEDRFHVVIEPPSRAPFTDNSDDLAKDDTKTDDTTKKKDEAEEATELYPIDFIDASAVSNLLVPSDNPEAFVVGDFSPYSSIGPVLPNPEGVSVPRPQLILDRADLYFTDSEALTGPDAAATIYAALAVAMKARDRHLKPRHQLKWLATLKKAGWDIDSPFITAKEREKAMQAKGWKTTEKEKDSFYQSYSDFSRLAFPKLRGRGLAVTYDTADSHPRIGVPLMPLDLPAFSSLSDADKKSHAGKKFYLYVSGKEKEAVLKAWMGSKNPWDVLGGSAADYFEVVEISSPVLDYSSSYATSKRFLLPTAHQIESLKTD